MNVQEWASKLNGREYCEELTAAEETQAKADGMVIVFGASDDLLEFRGMVHDEVGAWNGTKVKIAPRCELFDEDHNRNIQEYNKNDIQAMPEIEAIWSPQDKEGNTWASWHITAQFPHEPFDIMEEGELYCRGMVFHLQATRIWSR